MAIILVLLMFIVACQQSEPHYDRVEEAIELNEWLKHKCVVGERIKRTDGTIWVTDGCSSGQRSKTRIYP